MLVHAGLSVGLIRARRRQSDGQRERVPVLGRFVAVASTKVLPERADVWSLVQHRCLSNKWL